MRVAAVANLYPQLTESWIRLQLRELHRRGVDVSVLALGRGRDFPNPEPFSVEYVRHAWFDLPAALWREKGRVLAPDGLALLPHRLKAPLSTLAPDVVHCHFGHVGREVAHLKPSAPLVVSFYGYDAYRLPFVWGPDLFHSLFGRASAVLSLGPRMDERLLALGCPMNRLRRVPLAVDVHRFGFRPRNPTSRVRLVSIGRLVEKKGFSVGIEAAARLQRRLGVPVEYTIVGEGPLKQRLRREAARHEALSVRLVGAKSPAGVWEALDQSDVCLVPSLTAGHGDAEGTPVAALEAMALGRPVVASDNGDLPAVLGFGELGSVSPERDADDLARSMESALLGGAAWERRLFAARSHVETHHSPGSVGEALTLVYRNLFN